MAARVSSRLESRSLMKARLPLAIAIAIAHSFPLLDARGTGNNGVLSEFVKISRLGNRIRLRRTAGVRDEVRRTRGGFRGFR